MTTPLRFAIRFLILFAALVGGFEASRGTVIAHCVIDDLILAPTVALIDAASSAHTTLEGRSLVTGGTRLHVTRGCEGVELMLMIAAAVLAFPVSVRRRVRGALVGTALAYGLAIARLIVLDATLRDAPQAWEMLHGLITPLAPVIILILYFLRWSAAAEDAPRLEPDAA